jgi:CRP/FNR family transcriptional regulator
MEQKQEFVKCLFDIPLFKGLSKEEITPFADVAQMRLYRSNMYIYMEEDPLDRVFFIHSGKVKIYKTDLTGKEQIISILVPGEMFPYTGFFRDGHYTSHAEVLEDAQLIVIPIEYFEDILISHPSLCVNIFRKLGERIVDLQGRLEAQILHNTYEQIILLLIRLCQTNGTKTDKGYKYTSRFTNRELANMIGTTRETVSRTITQLKRKDYIFQNEEGFLYVDQESLKQEIFC